MHARPVFTAACACLLAVALLASCATQPRWSSYPSSLDEVSGDQWADDLRFLDAGLRARHPDPFHAGGEAAYTAILSQLQADAEGAPAGKSLADGMVTGIARLLATIGEGHTALNASPDAYFPLVTRWFGTGAARAAPRGAGPRGRLSRARLRADRGGRPVARRGAPAPGRVPVGRSPQRPRPERAGALINPRIARGLGLADATGLTVTLRRADPSTFDLTVPEVAAADLALIDIWTGSSAPRSLPYRHLGVARWYEVIDGTLFVQYNSCDLDAYGFFQGIVDELGDGRVDRLVVDLRRNGGGNSLPGTWFAKAVAGIRTVNRPGGIYVLVGPRTFSSAMMMAVDFMHHTEALFAGEPLAERVDMWGEVKRFALPASGLVVGHSSKFFVYSRGKNLRTIDGILVPDPGLERVPTYDEWAAGGDPVFDMAVGATP